MWAVRALFAVMQGQGCGVWCHCGEVAPVTTWLGVSCVTSGRGRFRLGDSDSGTAACPSTD
eukprot:scaffold186457_cov33-Tisochrysis_lutea.AAC.1